MTERTSDGARSAPVKIVIERRAHPGAKDAFEKWVKELIESAGRSTGLEGSSVLAAGGGDHFVLLRFASQGDLDRWQAWPEVVTLLQKADAFSTTLGQSSVQTGFETWFTLPGLPAPPGPPPKWKMALVTWSAVLPQVIALSFIVPRSLPFPLGSAVSSAILVAMLTWVVMPRLTKLLYPWLYPSARPAPSPPEAPARST
jgi:uncharacterized protein